MTDLPRKTLFGIALAAALSSGAGCQTFREATSLRSGRKTEEMASTSGITGPLERLVNTRRRDQAAVVDPWLASQGRAEYDAAELLYNGKQYKEARKQFKKIAKKYPKAPVREDSLFMVAECYYGEQNFARAQDAYDALVKEYPSTRYLDRFSQRQFEIARVWLQFPKVVSSDVIRTVNYDEPSKSEPLQIESVPTRDPTRIVPILPNFFDRSRPWFDTEGNALKALKSVWLNDPTGPLADDAVMLCASHYLRKEDWTEADRMYTLLREEYPKSPHTENAYVLGAHVKLMSYQGPAYDEKKLLDARHLKETTLKLYPQHPERERMLEEVRKIEEALAHHEWEKVEYYRRKRRPDSMAIYCRTIVDKYSGTTYADKARQLLPELEKKAVPFNEKVARSAYPKPAAAPEPEYKEPDTYEEPPGKVNVN